jgi:hypothetical protein
MWATENVLNPLLEEFAGLGPDLKALLLLEDQDIAQ